MSFSFQEELTNMLKKPPKAVVVNNQGISYINGSLVIPEGNLQTQAAKQTILVAGHEEGSLGINPFLCYLWKEQAKKPQAPWSPLPASNPNTSLVFHVYGLYS
ncbi:hypothetical protein DSO57_1035077 [Entomophthora muscae]|uniref:Uncharacterized protein n=1 Tax=Entomophthora muscae TaxID=34485 RepID=A0ACC2SPG0_9FUNG|nr:hypothetical protein DSO57_1035077 [Entomophthora muscae]